MTSRGYGFLTLTALVYLAANQSRVGWLYLIAAAMLGVLLVSAAAPALALWGLSASRQVFDAGGRPLGSRSLRPREGDLVQIAVRLTVPGRARPLVRVTVPCPLAGPSSLPLVFFLPQLQAPEHRLTATVRCARRGVFPLPPVAVETGAPFGLVRRRRSLAAAAEVVVYPRWYPLGERITAAALQAMEAARPRAGAGEAFFGTREYRPGDPVRAVHWRSSLRRGSLVVKEFEDTTRPEVAVALDLSREMGSGPQSSLEDSIRLAASLIRWALDALFPVYLLAPGAPLHALSWPHGLDYLARATVMPAASLSQGVVSCPDAAALIVLSSGPDTRTWDLLAARRRAPTVVVTLKGYGPDGGAAAGPIPAGLGQVTCRPGDDLAWVGAQALRALVAGGSEP